MFKIVNSVTDAYSNIPSEDVLGFSRRGDTLTAWAIDGASTLSAEAFTTFPDMSDSRWFAIALSSYLKTLTTHSAFEPGGMAAGVREIQASYFRVTRSQPTWSFPVAACVVAELTPSGSWVDITVHSYADCFILFRQSGSAPKVGAPYRGPVVPPLTWKPCSGFDGELLERLRRRRVQQLSNGETTALTLNPESAANCRVQRVRLKPPMHVFIGTDGLARLWSDYTVLDADSAMDSLIGHGLTSLIEKLRLYESALPERAPHQKARDDASALHIYCALES